MSTTTIKTRLSTLNLEHLILGTLLAYITLHLLDEGLFNFAAWAELRWQIPNYTVPKWLLHNVYFVFFLGLGYFIYRRQPAKFLPAGLGIVIWGFMNGLSHFIFSLIFWEYSPGLLSGLIFIAIAVLAYQRARQMDVLSPRVVGFSILTALLYWGLPITLFIEIDRLLGF
jgi:hypothetical protein